MKENMITVNTKRLSLAGMCLLLLGAVMAGCGQENGNRPTESEGTLATETTMQEEQEKTEEQTKGIEAPTSYVTEEEMALADYWKGSDEAALAKVMKKAANNEKVTIALIGGSITQGTSCANFGVLFYRQTNGEGGQFDVFVDGNPAATLDADFQGGWGNYAESMECFTSDSVAKHEIIIKKSDASTKDAFTILGLLVSDGKGN